MHDEQNVAYQAAILCLPYWKAEAKGRARKQITRGITFLTYAAHWIDDHFDPISLRELDEGLKQKLQICGPDELLKWEPRVQKLPNRMRKLAPENQRDQIQRAVRRIIYGGLMQNAATEERVAKLLKDYVHDFINGLSDPVKQKYREILASPFPRNLSIWVTTKVVIELLDCCGDDFSPDRSEFYNLLYGPVLYYQDREAEIEREKFGPAFGKDPLENLPNDEDMIKLVESCRSLVQPVLGSDALPASRQKQLQCLLRIYGDCIRQKVKESYEPFLASPRLELVSPPQPLRAIS